MAMFFKTIIMSLIKHLATKWLDEHLTKQVLMELALKVTSWTHTEKDDLLVKLAFENEHVLMEMIELTEEAAAIITEE